MHRQEVGELHLVMVATAVYKLENILTCPEKWEAAICILPPTLYPEVKIHPSTQSTRDLHQSVVYRCDQSWVCMLPYSWWSLNLVVWLQTERKKYWRNFNLAVASRSILLHHHEHYTLVYQGVLPSSLLKYLNNSKPISRNITESVLLHS